MLHELAAAALLLAFVQPADGTGRLACADSLTLAARSPVAEVTEFHDGLAVSPDGTRAAIGLSAPGAHARIGIRIVALPSMEVVRDIETGVYADALAWVAPRRLVARLGESIRIGSDGIPRPLLRPAAIVVDPASGAILQRRRISRAAARATVVPGVRGALTLLTRGADGRLLSVGSRGRVRSVPAGVLGGHVAGAARIPGGWLAYGSRGARTLTPAGRLRRVIARGVRLGDGDVHVAGGRAYVRTPGGLRIVSLETGRRVGLLRPAPDLRATARCGGG